ncbi:MAG: hypothetical protein C0179_05085 [Fervidicoccus sp.]|nr:MAG: hypothetical protein C0179_05085 [Fervidicoccus sp.]
MYRFLESRDWKRVYHLSSLDEDKDLKRIIRLFERNSTIKGSVGDATIYVISIYCLDPHSRSGKVFIAPLVVERSSSGYTVKMGYEAFDSFSASSEEEAEKFVGERFGGFVRLLERAVSTGSPNAVRLIEIAKCSEEFTLINFLGKIYGDEILNGDTIPGLYSTCSGESNFFINDKVVVIRDIYLFAVRDIRNDEIFTYSINAIVGEKLSEVIPKYKIFYKSLFIGLRDLPEPEFVIKNSLGDEYAFSSSKAVVDRRKVSLVVVGAYDHGKWFIRDVVAISCDVGHGDECSVYSFRMGLAFNYIRSISISASLDIREAVSKYIMWSRGIHDEIKKQLVKELIEKSKWEILPA